MGVAESLSRGTGALILAGALIFAGGLVTTGDATTVVKLSFTDAGSLSALASNRLTCHICVVDSVLSNPGIPVIRIPLSTFK